MTDAPFQFFDVHVTCARRLTPAMHRVDLGGSDIGRMASAGRDQRIKLFLPHPGQDAPVMPELTDDWYAAWRALDPAVRGIMRTYTIRDLNAATLTVDFALHGTAAPASRWATRARAGDRIGVFAPVDAENAAYDFRPPEDTEWLLLAGDESALPAIAAILEHLPAGLPVRVWIELRDAADRQPLPTRADATVTWLTDERATSGPPPSDRTAQAVRTALLPTGTPYAWIAGESSSVKSLRRHLVSERGMDRTRIKFSGYWRRGASEDQLLIQDEAA
ncbi:Vibriobactin utilization protein ViuB [Streptomyces sp. YIM 130001]|uniref:siderophore-interacting protein n=1 Tax=Streptomyces sp. YIM 130001 TaxID=2259644 RepID=UPI000E6493F7|nr:siderophore-interacting protein [Streptomyces sp. YIM 130001]RII18918.1 Vibriobactin utilization protein ViuB [Streptomyces sp. YIM 130001]